MIIILNLSLILQCYLQIACVSRIVSLCPNHIFDLNVEICGSQHFCRSFILHFNNAWSTNFHVTTNEYNFCSSLYRHLEWLLHCIKAKIYHNVMSVFKVHLQGNFVMPLFSWFNFSGFYLKKMALRFTSF